MRRSLAILAAIVAAILGLSCLGKSSKESPDIVSAAATNVPQAILGNWRGTTMTVQGNTCGPDVAGDYADSVFVIQIPVVGVSGDVSVSHYNSTGTTLGIGPGAVSGMTVTAQLSEGTTAEAATIGFNPDGITASVQVSVTGQACTLSGTINLTKCTSTVGGTTC